MKNVRDTTTTILQELKDASVLSTEEFELLQDSYTQGRDSFVEKLSECSEQVIENVYAYFSKEWCLDYLKTLSFSGLSEEILSLLDPGYLKKNLCCPYMMQDGKLYVALADPLNYTQAHNLSVLTGYPLVIVLTSIGTLNSLIHAVTESQTKKSDVLATEVGDHAVSGSAIHIEKPEDLLDMANKAPVIKLVNSLLYEGIKQRSTDIHIQPLEDTLAVKYRIDGVLHTIHELPISMHQALISRIKVMSHLDIAEKRRPQDGRMSIVFQDTKIDIRVSILPLLDRERIVLRILDKRNMFHDLSQLGLEEEQLSWLKKTLERKHGLLFVCGPTGSGKTTTLYAGISSLNIRENNIITVEDPIEYSLPGISQMQVFEKAGFQFSDGLRSILRHDPDVIMVGEVRDLETAKITIRASLTGHLVFSTLHTTDVAESISRLLDLGVKSFLLASSLSLLVAQRLVRRICPHCKESYTPDTEWLSRWEVLVKKADISTFFRGKGCTECHDTGFLGRIGVFEVAPITESIRQGIRSNQDSQTIRDLLQQDENFMDLLTSGLRKVKQGLTTIEEVVMATEI